MGHTFNRPDEAAMLRILERHPHSPEGAILRLAWLEGLSRSEITELRWDQVDFEGKAIQLPDRTVPLEPSTETCLRERHVRCALRDPHVVISERSKKPMPPESISRLSRLALDSEGQKVNLMDLRHDFVIRQLQTHDWPYVARVSGMAVSTLRDAFSPYLTKPAAPENPLAQRDEAEYLLWRVIQQEGSSPAGLALWMGWKLQMQPGEILNLTWSQVDLDRGLLRLPDREIPIGSRLSRLLGDVCGHRKNPAQDRVLLTPGTGKPMDLARLSTVIRTALIRGGLEQLSLGDLSRLSRRGSQRQTVLARLSAVPDPRGGHGPAGRVQKRRAEAAEPAPSGRSRGPYRRVLLPGGGRGPAGGPVRRGDGLPRRPRHRRPEGAGGASEPAPRPVYGAAAAHGRPGRAPPHRQAVRPATQGKAP